jgi:hypothetical protein
MTSINRRNFLRGASAVLGAAAGTRSLGPLFPDAQAAGEPSHLVFVYFPGGYNALFGGCADVYSGSGAFDVTGTNIKNVGDGVFTDASTLGTLPDFALQHWAAMGVKHGSSLHTTPTNTQSGGERVFCRRGSTSYLTSLAAAMGGNGALKAVHLGDYPAYRTQPAAGDVSLQRILDLQEALRTTGAIADDPAKPARDLSAIALGSAEELSANPFSRNPESLRSLNDGYKAAATTLAVPAPPSLTLADIKTAYGLTSNAVGSFASQLAGAEVMIRAAGSNVLSVFDSGFVGWDFHQVSGARSLNGLYSRNKFLGIGGRENKVTALKTFCSRMLNLPGRNVVLCLTGDFVRLPNGDHGDGAVATVMGKNIKRGRYFGCSATSRFAAGTPNMDGFWAGLAAAVGVPGTPFGANPYAIL